MTNYSNPDKIEQDLKSLIPREEWRNFSLRLIFYGRKFCPSRKEKEQCIVADINPNNPYKNCPLSIEMRNFFKKVSIGIVGVSLNPQKYGARIFKTLLHQGYKVNGVSPKGGVVENKKLFKSVDDFLSKIDSKNILLIFVVPPTISKKVIDGLKNKNISVWFQPGSYDRMVLLSARNQHMEVFYSQCFMKLNGLW